MTGPAFRLCIGLAAPSCGLFTSFDDYALAPFRVRATVVGLEDSAKATLALNGKPAGEIGDALVFEFPARLADRAPYVVTARAPGHRCDDATGTVHGADANIVVHCFSEDATLTNLRLIRGSFLATLVPPFTPEGEAYDASLPLIGPDLEVLATAKSPRATLTIDGRTELSGVASTVPFSGANVLGIRVVAASGNERRYTLALTSRSTYVKASNTREKAQFGTAVALSGDTLAVSAPGEDSAAQGINGDPSNTTAPFAGAVYVFTRTDGKWSQEAYVKASNTRPGAYFGSSVALEGDTLVVGASRESSGASGVDADPQDTSASGAGAVYVFTRTARKWTQQAYIKASNARSNSLFGSAVALSGDTLAVGAPGETSGAQGIDGNQADTSAYGAGAAYVFTRPSGKWSQQAYVKASNTRPKAPFGAPAAFGTAVALAGDTLVVGAPGENSKSTGVNGDQAAGGADEAGAVYVFERSGTTWSQGAYIKASNTTYGAKFGSSLALSADTLAVGAPWERGNAKGVNGTSSGNATAAGAVFVFGRMAGTWWQEAYVKATNTHPFMFFGSAVALASDQLAIGAPGEKSNATGAGGDQSNQTLENAGAVYLLRREQRRYAHEVYVKASNTNALWQFGSSLALAADTLGIGAPGEGGKATGVGGPDDDRSLPAAGAVYVY